MAYAITGARGVWYEDLEFSRRPLACFSSCGTPYSRWLRCGVPKIPQTILDCVFYLYKDRASAEKGENFGGTGFLIGEITGDPTQLFIYGVTNWHVAVRDGYSVMRVNTKDEGVDILELSPEDWTFIPRADDVAISPLLKLDQHRISVVSRNQLATKGRLNRHRVGVGDDVFMVGRFVDHDGGATNRPAARFGNISVMPTPVEQPTGAKRDTFLIDMHSRTGYSGSPVFVYRTPGNNLEPRRGSLTDTDTRERFIEEFFSDGFFMLLGIHWGQFPEEWKINEKKENSEEIESLVVEGAVVSGLSGMTCVVPADRILDIFDLPELKGHREKRNMDLEKKRDSTPIAESAEKPKNVATRQDEILRTMLSTPPSPRKKVGNRVKRK